MYISTSIFFVINRLTEKKLLAFKQKSLTLKFKIVIILKNKYYLYKSKDDNIHKVSNNLLTNRQFVL